MIKKNSLSSYATKGKKIRLKGGGACSKKGRACLVTATPSPSIARRGRKTRFFKNIQNNNNKKKEGFFKKNEQLALAPSVAQELRPVL